MKKCILIPAIIGLLNCNAIAQTADQWVAQGRSDLASQNLTSANAAFAQAVTLSPTNETANAFYAITRLLVLPSQPAGSNFLTRIGVPVAGRDIYDLTARLTEDTNGVPLAPAGVNADEFIIQARTNILPAISGAIGNLASITDTNFTLDLTSNETSLAAVTMDYGDFKLIQAGLYGAEYLIYVLNGQNLNAQLADVRGLYTNGILSISQVLSDYPALFTFANTNDLGAAQSAFSSGVSTYMTASSFIRSRPTNEVRLFNYDKVSAQSEGDFRLTLQDLANSLVLGTQWLSVDPALAVDMGAQFTGSTTWRSLLPKFDGNAIELGSFPDLTFGGTIYGLTTGQVESAFSHLFVMLPVGAPPQLSSSNTINLAFTTLSGHNYALQVSSNLVNWRVVAAFTATSELSQGMDYPSASTRFYRLRDDSGFMAFYGMLLDVNTRSPIAGAQIQSVYDGASTTTDANGQFYLLTTLPAWWGYDQLQISAPGYGTVYNYYFGNGLVSGLQIELAPQ